MLQIQDIVNVTISRETASKTVRDLQTIAILSKHDRFTEAYRKYSSTKEMLDEGFITTDFAYIAAQRIFKQEPTVREIVVGRIATSTSSVDYPKEVAALQAANSDWLFLIADAKDAADKIAIAKYVEDETTPIGKSFVLGETVEEDVTVVPMHCNIKSTGVIVLENDTPINKEYV